MVKVSHVDVDESLQSNDKDSGERGHGNSGSTEFVEGSCTVNEGRVVTSIGGTDGDGTATRSRQGSRRGRSRRSRFVRGWDNETLTTIGMMTKLESPDVNLRRGGGVWGDGS